ncbi:MAG: hypothetical protein ACQSGP_09275 [Frankia sp.]
MSAILPLLGGLLLGRFAPVRPAIAVQIAFYAVAAAALIATAPNHGSGYAGGVILSLVLAPLSAVAYFIGWSWRRRAQRA